MQYKVGYRGPCSVDGCNKQRWKQGLCYKHANRAGLVSMPKCALEGCERQAQTAGEGSLCRPCRNVMSCSTPGCSRAPRSTGQCLPCANGEIRDVCLLDGCANLSHGHRRCPKHRRNPEKCVRSNCSGIAAQDGVCGGCLTDSPKFCRLAGCPSPRYKSRLCYKHHRESLAHECAHPRCVNMVEGEYCGVHDIGIDFAAGDWFDWVAAERLFRGQLAGRKPTIPELVEAMRIADRRSVPYSEMATRLGLDERMWGIWRGQIARLSEAQGVAA